MAQTDTSPIWSPSRDLPVTPQPAPRTAARGTLERDSSGLLQIRIDLSASVSLEGLRDAALRFLRWLTSELSELVPVTLRRRLSSTFPRYAIIREAGVWRLGVRDDATIALDPQQQDAALREQIVRAAPQALSARSDVELLASEVLVRRIRLAAAARAHLRSAVRLQLERLSPFKANDVAFDCRVEEEADGEIHVAVALVPRATLDALEQRVSALGLEVGRFQTADGWEFTTEHWRPTRQEKVQLSLLGIGLVSILVAILVAPTLRDAELDSLDAQLTTMREPARQAALLRDEWQNVRDPIQALSMRLGGPNPLDVLKDLTNRLPDDVTLSLLTLDGDSVLLEGTAPDAKRVADALNRMGGFSAVRLHREHPTSQGQSFEITMTLAKADVP